MAALRRFERDEGGAVAVIVAIMLSLTFVAAVTLVLDGGRLWVERSQAQNAADHAALAAAWAGCNGGDAVAAGLNSANRNGFDNGGTNNVTITDLGDQRWRATVDVPDVEAFLGSYPFVSIMFGGDDLSVGARAIAGCVPSPTGGAIYAHGGCSQSIDWSGSGIYITGDVHTNGQLYIGGSGNHVEGFGTYTTTYSGGPSKITWDPSENNPSQVAGRDWPIFFDYNAFTGSGTYTSDPNYFTANNSKIDRSWLQSRGRMSGNTILPGIYHTNGDVDLGDSNLNGQVTFIAGGEIKFSGSNQNFSPYRDDLLAFSHSSGGCNDEGILLSGSSSTWEGIIFADRSRVELSGSSNSTVEGTIVAWAIRLNGSNINVAYGGTGDGGEPFVWVFE